MDHNFRPLYPFFKPKKPLESSRSQLSNAFFRLKNHLEGQKLWAILVGCILTPTKYIIKCHPSSSRVGWLFTLVTPSPTKKKTLRPPKNREKGSTLAKKKPGILFPVFGEFPEKTGKKKTLVLSKSTRPRANFGAAQSTGPFVLNILG